MLQIIPCDRVEVDSFNAHLSGGVGSQSGVHLLVDSQRISKPRFPKTHPPSACSALPMAFLIALGVFSIGMVYEHFDCRSVLGRCFH